MADDTAGGAAVTHADLGSAPTQPPAPDLELGSPPSTAGSDASAPPAFTRPPPIIRRSLINPKSHVLNKGGRKRGRRGRNGGKKKSQTTHTRRQQHKLDPADIDYYNDVEDVGDDSGNQDALPSIISPAAARVAAVLATDVVHIDVERDVRLGERDEDAIPYRLQGNIGYNSPDNMYVRRSFRKHPLVQQELGRFWACFSKIDPKRGLLRRHFIDVYLKIAKVLVLSWDYDRAYTSALNDWNKEASYRKGMTRDEFCDSLFELADIWTEHVDLEEYVLFLRGLFHSITNVTREDSRGELYCDYEWKPLSAIAGNIVAPRDAAAPALGQGHDLPDDHNAYVAPTKPVAKKSTRTQSFQFSPRPQHTSKPRPEKPVATPTSPPRVLTNTLPSGRRVKIVLTPGGARTVPADADENNLPQGTVPSFRSRTDMQRRRTERGSKWTFKDDRNPRRYVVGDEQRGRQYSVLNQPDDPAASGGAHHLGANFTLTSSGGGSEKQVMAASGAEKHTVGGSLSTPRGRRNRQWKLLSTAVKTTSSFRTAPFSPSANSMQIQGSGTASTGTGDATKGDSTRPDPYFTGHKPITGRVLGPQAVHGARDVPELSQAHYVLGHQGIVGRSAVGSAGATRGVAQESTTNAAAGVVTMAAGVLTAKRVSAKKSSSSPRQAPDSAQRIKGDAPDVPLEVVLDGRDEEEANIAAVVQQAQAALERSQGKASDRLVVTNSWGGGTETPASGPSNTLLVDSPKQQGVAEMGALRSQASGSPLAQFVNPFGSSSVSAGTTSGGSAAPSTTRTDPSTASLQLKTADEDFARQHGSTTSVDLALARIRREFDQFANGTEDYDDSDEEDNDNKGASGSLSKARNTGVGRSKPVPTGRDSKGSSESPKYSTFHPGIKDADRIPIFSGAAAADDSKAQHVSGTPSSDAVITAAATNSDGTTTGSDVTASEAALARQRQLERSRLKRRTRVFGSAASSTQDTIVSNDVSQPTADTAGAGVGFGSAGGVHGRRTGTRSVRGTVKVAIMVPDNLKLQTQVDHTDLEWKKQENHAWEAAHKQEVEEAETDPELSAHVAEYLDRLINEQYRHIVRLPAPVPAPRAPTRLTRALDMAHLPPPRLPCTLQSRTPPSSPPHMKGSRGDLGSVAVSTRADPEIIPHSGRLRFRRAPAPRVRVPSERHRRKSHLMAGRVRGREQRATPRKPASSFSGLYPSSATVDYSGVTSHNRPHANPHREVAGGHDGSLLSRLLLLMPRSAVHSANSDRSMSPSSDFAHLPALVKSAAPVAGQLTPPASPPRELAKRQHVGSKPDLRLPAPAKTRKQKRHLELSVDVEERTADAQVVRTPLSPLHDPGLAAAPPRRVSIMPSQRSSRRGKTGAPSFLSSALAAAASSSKATPAEPQQQEEEVRTTDVDRPRTAEPTEDELKENPLAFGVSLYQEVKLPGRAKSPINVIEPFEVKVVRSPRGALPVGPRSPRLARTVLTATTMMGGSEHTAPPVSLDSDDDGSAPGDIIDALRKATEQRREQRRHARERRAARKAAALLAKQSEDKQVQPQSGSEKSDSASGVSSRQQEQEQRPSLGIHGLRRMHLPKYDYSAGL